MIRFALALLGVLSLVGSAEACNRCGRFGNSCRFYSASHYVAPVVKHDNHVHNHDNRETLNFIFNNSYPVPLLAQQGNTAYGVSLAIKDHSIDPQLFLDRAARYMDNAQQSASEGFAGFLAAGTLQLNNQTDLEKQKLQGINAVSALNAAKGEPSQPFSFKLQGTVGSDGSVSLEPIEDGGRLSLSDNSNILKEKCASCHKSGGGATPFTPENSERLYLRWGQMAHHGIKVPEDMSSVVEMSDEQKVQVSQALLGLSVKK